MSLNLSSSPKYLLLKKSYVRFIRSQIFVFLSVNVSVKKNMSFYMSKKKSHSLVEEIVPVTEVRVS